MKKYLLIIVVFLACNIHAPGQHFGPAKEDSIRYIGLRNKLPVTQGKEKVDLLNAISEMSVMLGAGWDTALMHRKSDTVKYYASQALELATKIGYNDGVAMALINLNQHSFVDSMPPAPIRDRDVRQKNILNAIKLAEQTSNYEILGKAYDALGTVAPANEDDKSFLDRFTKSESYYQKAKDTEALSNTYTWITAWYADKGNYEKAIEYGEKSLEFLKNENIKLVNWHQFLVQEALWQMADLYSNIGDYESSMSYFKQANQYGLKNNTGWLMNGAIAGLFCEMHQYDSAMVYWKLWRKEPGYEAMAGGAKASGYSILAEIYIVNKKYDSALQIAEDNIERIKPYNNFWGIGSEWFRIARIYNEKGEYNRALEYLNKAFELSDKYAPSKNEMIKRYQVLSSVYHSLGNNDSAYKYLLKYVTIKDSIENKQLLLRLYKQKLDANTQQAKAQLSLLNIDNALKSEQLNRESMQKRFLLILLLALTLAAIFIYRSISFERRNERLRLENELTVQRLESENKHIALQRQSTELEMQALRSQMNPHFIFNSLSSINHFILRNESKTASNYLTRFSRLIRMVLINSQKSLITLNDELEMLRIYLDMERLRFKNSFDYFIMFKNEIDIETVFVPPLMLQPFCENALWHGLMHKEGHGNLTIDLSMSNNVLECVISDDGIGREKAAELKSTSTAKEKSLGLQITTQRLHLLNQTANMQTIFSIEDVLDEHKNICGTKVILQIGHKELKKELV